MNAIWHVVALPKPVLPRPRPTGLPCAVEGTICGKRLQDGHHERADRGNRVGELLRRPGHVRLAEVRTPLDLLDLACCERRRERHRRRRRHRRLAALERRRDRPRKEIAGVLSRLSQDPYVEEVLEPRVRHIQHNHRLELLRDARLGRVGEQPWAVSVEE